MRRRRPKDYGKWYSRLSLPSQSGVYRIRNIVTNDSYIGATRNIRFRCLYQRSQLRNGVHHAPRLQMAFSVYGSDQFVYEVLILCALTDLSFYEDRAIRILNSAYNTKPSSARPAWHTQIQVNQPAAEERGSDDDANRATQAAD